MEKPSSFPSTFHLELLKYSFFITAREHLAHNEGKNKFYLFLNEKRRGIKNLFVCESYLNFQAVRQMNFRAIKRINFYANSK
jgi:hypothetical protein